jgi:hypothetical protein
LVVVDAADLVVAVDLVEVVDFAMVVVMVVEVVVVVVVEVVVFVVVVAREARHIELLSAVSAALRFRRSSFPFFKSTREPECKTKLEIRM